MGIDSSSSWGHVRELSVKASRAPLGVRCRIRARDLIGLLADWFKLRTWGLRAKRLEEVCPSTGSEMGFARKAPLGKGVSVR